MSKPAYRPELDSLRAIAITIVMLHHYVRRELPVSGFGVVLFFVLSGYFGTRALLGLRESLGENGFGFGHALRVFYGRRYLRILPPHLFVIMVATAFAVPYARERFWWNVSFTSNWGMLLADEWFGRFSPLWSLAVLEQFYLVWPALILLLPRRALAPLIFAAIGLAFAYRWVALAMSFGGFAWVMVPITGLDQLATGGLLALWQRSSADNAKLRALLFIGGPVCGSMMAVIVLWRIVLGGGPPFLAMYVAFVASLFFLWVIERCLRGIEGPIGKFLRMPWLAAAGQVSYAAFLFHSFTELLIPKIGPLAHFMETDYKAFILVPLTFVFAHLSWICLEKPVSVFRKSRFAPPKPIPLVPPGG